ncbi:hypothetical protein OG689_19805 [Kitasatospora sp. NBC_00240]|uniref:hypothetical protein n=1 Tax=Kitasatospora sp. NBC_00240 TaxID=2903567 RepID=UPI002253C773|nr:hypothetical protein [Kitasatospora sp. NBC_00240]MCX5211504.1 hypothetical protein [Kitasatospora sp. NBC_00240]
MDEDLRARLREAAAAHRPDRARMLARVERGTAREARPDRAPARTGAASWPRVWITALATAGALVVGGFAVASVVRERTPRPPGVTGPTAPSPSPSRSPSRSAGPPAPTTPAEPAPARSATASPATATGAASAPAGPTAPASATAGPTAPAGGSHTEDGPLWSDGSVDPDSTTTWAQSNVTLKARKPLTSLTVELRIARTAGVQDAGSRQSLPAEDFTVSVRVEGDVLVYRWTLRAGRSVPVGQHLFAGRYDHAPGGRDAKDDTYRADARSADAGASVWGDFARTH